MKDLISNIRSAFESSDCLNNTEVVYRILKNYASNPNDWAQYAHFDSHKYTRNLVDSGNGKYNLMILCWGPGMGSSIHDHTDSHCFVKVLHGELLETRFAWPNDVSPGNEEDEDEKEQTFSISNKNDSTPMTRVEMQKYAINNVTYINDKIGLHRMENPSHSEPTVTLHLYVPPYNCCYAFDERTAKRTKATVTFYSKFGEKVDYTPNNV